MESPDEYEGLWNEAMFSFWIFARSDSKRKSALSFLFGGLCFLPKEKFPFLFLFGHCWVPWGSLLSGWSSLCSFTGNIGASFLFLWGFCSWGTEVIWVIACREKSLPCMDPVIWPCICQTKRAQVLKSNECNPPGIVCKRGPSLVFCL